MQSLPGLLLEVLYWVEGRPLIGSSLASGGIVYVGRLPAWCAILVPRFAHGSQSIAKTARPVDQVFEGTEC